MARNTSLESELAQVKEELARVDLELSAVHGALFLCFDAVGIEAKEGQRWLSDVKPKIMEKLAAIKGKEDGR
jgi:hypothetical protein